MATITSTSSGGKWSSTTSWQGGSVPNLSVDDVIILPTAAITMDTNLTLASGRTITIQDNGNSQGTLQANDPYSLTINGTLDLRGRISTNGNVTVGSTGVLLVKNPSSTSLTSVVTIQNTKTLTNNGCIVVELYGEIQVIESTVLIASGSTFAIYGTVQMGSYSMFTINTATVDFYGRLLLGAQVSMVSLNNGKMLMYPTATIAGPNGATLVKVVDTSLRPVRK